METLQDKTKTGFIKTYNINNKIMMKIRYYSTNFPKPVILYKNADLNKLDIFAENKNKMGVYRWINNVNGNTYVGSSVNISVRLYTYYSLISLSKSNRIIDKALLKYGFSNFSLEILEYCNNKEDVIKREQYFLDLLKPQYNIVQTAGSTLGYKHTPESLIKMRNFILSDEIKIKKALSTKNASEARRISVIVENIDTKEILEYTSMTEAGKSLGVHRNAISQAILNNRLVKKKYKITKNM